MRLDAWRSAYSAVGKGPTNPVIRQDKFQKSRYGLTWFLSFVMANPDLSRRFDAKYSAAKRRGEPFLELLAKDFKQFAASVEEANIFI